MGEHRRSCPRVGECLVGTIVRDVVAFADVDQTVRLQVLGIEPPRQAQCAQSSIEPVELALGPAGAASGTQEELAVETSVVRDEEGVAHAFGELGEDGTELRRAFQHRTGDAVDIGRPDAPERPAQPYEGLPLVDLVAVCVDRDHGQLQDAVTARVEARGFDVDDGEVGEGHDRHLTHGVSRR